MTRRAAKAAVPGVVAIALSLTAAFGGLKQAPDPPPERYAVGQVIDQTWFHTQVTRAYIAQASGQKPGIPALHVELRVTNMDNVPTYQDPIITLGAAKDTAFLRDGWLHSPAMNVYADGKRRGFVGSEVKSTAGTDTYTLPPHIPVVMDTQWEMFRFHEKPGNIQVMLTGYEKRQKEFYDIPDYWTVIAEPEKPGSTGTQNEKPKMLSAVHVPLSPSGFKPHPPAPKKPHAKPTHKPKSHGKDGKHGKHRKHRKPR